MLDQSSATTKIIAALCAVPFLAILLLFEVLPLALVAINSLFVEEGGPTLANYADILTSAFQRHAFATSLLLSVVTAALGIVLGLPIAVILRDMPKSVQRAILTYSNLCANFTGFPVAFAFIIMFGLAASSPCCCHILASRASTFIQRAAWCWCSLISRCRSVSCWSTPASAP